MAIKYVLQVLYFIIHYVYFKFSLFGIISCLSSGLTLVYFGSKLMGFRIDYESVNKPAKEKLKNLSVFTSLSAFLLKLINKLKHSTK